MGKQDNLKNKWTSQQIEKLKSESKKKSFDAEKFAKENGKSGASAVKQKLRKLNLKKNKKSKSQKSKIQKEEGKGDALTPESSRAINRTVISSSDAKIKVSEAPIKEEAEEMRQMYINAEGHIEEEEKNDPEPSKEAESSQKQAEPEEEEESPEKRQYIRHSEKVDWSGADDLVIFFIEQRFLSYNKKHGQEIIKPFSDEEKNQLKNGITEVLEKRAKIISEYADLLNLGLALIITMWPRIAAGFRYNKENGIEMPIEGNKKNPEPELQQTANPADSPGRNPQIIRSSDPSEQERAIREYEEIMKNQ